MTKWRNVVFLDVNNSKVRNFHEGFIFAKLRNYFAGAVAKVGDIKTIAKSFGRNHSAAKFTYVGYSFLTSHVFNAVRKIKFSCTEHV